MLQFRLILGRTQMGSGQIRPRSGWTCGLSLAQPVLPELQKSQSRTGGVEPHVPGSQGHKA